MAWVCVLSDSWLFYSTLSYIVSNVLLNKIIENKICAYLNLTELLFCYRTSATIQKEAPSIVLEWRVMTKTSYRHIMRRERKNWPDFNCVRNHGLPELLLGTLKPICQGTYDANSHLSFTKVWLTRSSRCIFRCLDNSICSPSDLDLAN